MRQHKLKFVEIWMVGLICKRGGCPSDGGCVDDTACRSKTPVSHFNLPCGKTSARSHSWLAPHSRPELVVLAVDVGGRWSRRDKGFLSKLARALAKEDVPLLRCRAKQACCDCGGAPCSRVQLRRLSHYLLNLLHRHGDDGETPRHTRWTVTTSTLGSSLCEALWFA